jgi:small GTP-binding protein
MNNIMNKNKNLSRIYNVCNYILIGHEMVGKTSIINRYFDDLFIQNLPRTFAIDFKSKNIKINNDKEIIIRIWDTAGQERYDAITTNYYKKGDCILLCFSIYDKISFDKLNYYLDKINQYKNDNAIIVLVGTFYDKNKERVVSLDEIKQFSKLNNLEYFEISSKTGIGINELFNRTINLSKKNIKTVIYDKILDDDINNNKYGTACCNLL